jgi:hypothetical protein
MAGTALGLAEGKVINVRVCDMEDGELPQHMLRRLAMQVLPLADGSDACPDCVEYVKRNYIPEQLKLIDDD